MTVAAPMILACATLSLLVPCNPSWVLSISVYPLHLIEMHHMDVEKMEDMVGTRSIYFATDEVYAFPRRL